MSRHIKAALVVMAFFAAVALLVFGMTAAPKLTVGIVVAVVGAIVYLTALAGSK